MSKDNRISRREFIRKSAEVTGVAIIGADLLSAEARPVRTASDWVPLGRLNKKGIRIPRLGMGTGSINGNVQRALGQDGFNRLVAHAYERGVRYIDTADQYKIHTMVREAIRANKIPRDKIFIQSKMRWIEEENRTQPLKVLDRFRQELGTDYLDSLLIHCTTEPDWPEKLKPMMDAFDEAQQRGWIRAKGMSCHGLRALREATKSDWIEVQLARINPQGHHVDQDLPNVHDPRGKFGEAMKEIKAMHAKGRGIIGMKLCGNGDFTNAEDREKAIRYAMTCGFVDAVVIGFKSPAEIDEAIERVNRALASKT
ncbi:MAG TPA: aldo/keto reductase [Blastocatellia bacterium]|nr:aldo/keto reductase [Blastocatellia bacterium]